MPAPTNISAATATVIGALPYSTSQNVNDAGTTYTVWYVYIPTADGMVSVFGFGDLVTYKPRLQIFSPDGTTDHPTGTGINVPIQFYGQAGVPFYFKFDSSTGNVGAAVLLLTASALATAATIPVGSFAVPDDHVGLPLGVFSATASNTPLTYVLPFTSGYNADVLANGLAAVENNVNEVANGDIVLDLVDATFTTLNTLTWAMPSSGWQQTVIGGNRVDRFYVGWPFDSDNFSGASSFRIVQENGTASAAVELTGMNTLTGLAPSNNDAILYASLRQGAGDYRIKRWDVVNGVFLTDLAANVADYRPHDLLVLSNDSVVVLYQQVSGSNRRIIVYSSAGAVISTTNYGSYDSRLAYDADYSVFWALMLGTVASGNLGTATFRKVNPATGADLVTRTYYGFDNGVYEGAATATPPASFGISADSSPFWLLREVIAPVEPVFPDITDLSATMNCVRPGIQVVTITGTGFADGDAVTITDPEGDPVDDVTVTVVSDTEITTQFTASSFGPYCFTVTSPDELSSHTVCTTAICDDTQTIRRLRRTTHISNENLWTYFDSLTVAFEAGTGLTEGLGVNPKLMLRWSDDGGHIWSNWHAIEIGKLGDYKHRAIWRRLGRSRNRTWELVHSDPTKIVLIDGYLDIKEGTS